MTTYEDMIKDVLPSIGLDREPIPLDVLDVAISTLNVWGEKVHNAFSWRNARTLEATAPTPDSSGVITFPEHVDVIRAVRFVDMQQESSPAFAEDEILSFQRGGSSVLDGVRILPSDASGLRRMQVDPSKVTDGTVIKYLALSRFVKVTRSNYTTAFFPIDRAYTALAEYFADAMQMKYRGIPMSDRGQNALTRALVRENEMEARETQVFPRYPEFDEIGNW